MINLCVEYILIFFLQFYPAEVLLASADQEPFAAQGIRGIKRLEVADLLSVHVNAALLHGTSAVGTGLHKTGFNKQAYDIDRAVFQVISCQHAGGHICRGAAFNTYPQACFNGDQTTRWAAYANTPMEKSVKDMLYPSLKKTVTGMSERDAVGVILNWVQTAFEYGYDDQIWGGDRAFFAQETLYYPYCDCEDRAILFSRLVRDLVGLDVVLLYYPGHLATAVAFSNEVNGDYLTYKSRKYVVCDPTYINAGVGRTMPGMNNQEAQVIALK